MEFSQIEKDLRVNDAVQRGILEMLLTPEYSRDWILELAETTFGNDPSESIIDEVDDRFLNEMLAIAKTVVKNIEDGSVRAIYEDRIAEHESNQA